MNLELRGPAYEWALWSSAMRIATEDPHTLPAVKRLVDAELVAVEQAVSPTLRDSELNRLVRHAGRPMSVSATFAALLQTALLQARRSGGDMDPTLGDPMASLAADDRHELVECGSFLAPCGLHVSVVRRRSPGWQRIRLDLDALTVTMPADVRLDLSPVARAWVADRCAAVVGDRLGIPVLVALGGDVASGGPAPALPWTVLAQDSEVARAGEPSALVTLPAGAAVSTASTASAQWLRDAREIRAVLTPGTGRSGRRFERTWRTATVVADSCVEASTRAGSALLRGPMALDELEQLGLAARLVEEDGHCRYAGSWPAAAELAA